MILKIFCLLLWILKVHGSNDPEVCLSQGACFKGSWIENEGNRFAAFRGIRYALPPVNEMRFKAPQEFVVGDAYFDVSEDFNVKCVQTDTISGELNGEEDCLFLNVYVPENVFMTNVTNTVMVFIHGGALIDGTGVFDMYGPHFFMEKDIVLVTINYRLGVFGFLSLGTEQVPGNAGLRDQSMALQWVHDNIDCFNGDAKSVTIFGESAGSQSVGLQLISPQSRGLFQRIIMQSGTPTVYWASIAPDQALDDAAKLSDLVECPKHDLQCLQSKSVTDLLTSGIVIHAPVVDQDFTNDPFLPERAEDLLDKGLFDKNIDVIIGHNHDEGLLELLTTPGNVLVSPEPENWAEFRAFFVENADIALFGRDDTDTSRVDQVVEFYVKSIENIDESHRQRVVDMFSDSLFFFDTFKMIEYFLKHGINPYFYVLTHEGQHSLTDLYGIDHPKGVCHGDDLFYLFHNIFGNVLTFDPEDKAVKDHMIDAWTSFAKVGDPNSPESSNAWTRVMADMPISYWNIDSGSPSMAVIDSDMQERIALWKNLMGNE